jgi:hypothetical protein
MKDVQFRHKYSVGVCGGPRGEGGGGDILSNKCNDEKKIKSTYNGVS